MKKMASKKPIISLKNVTKTYYLGDEAVHAVTNIDLEIFKEEYLSILGTSGCGKSTLMYIIGLLETPTSGRVLLDNKQVKDLTDAKLSHLRNRYIGFVFQSFNLINKFTVLENVLLPTRYLKSKLDYDPQKRALELSTSLASFTAKNSFPTKYQEVSSNEPP